LYQPRLVQNLDTRRLSSNPSPIVGHSGAPEAGLMDSRVFCVGISSSQQSVFIVDLWSMEIVYRLTNLLQVPALLKTNHFIHSEEQSQGLYRPITSVTADFTPSSLMKSHGGDFPLGDLSCDGESPMLPSNRKLKDARVHRDDILLTVELVDLHPDDAGPTLIAFITGRPILIYRGFSLPISLLNPSFTPPSSPFNNRRGFTETHDLFPFRFLLFTHGETEAIQDKRYWLDTAHATSSEATISHSFSSSSPPRIKEEGEPAETSTSVMNVDGKDEVDKLSFHKPVESTADTFLASITALSEAIHSQESDPYSPTDLKEETPAEASDTFQPLWEQRSTLDSALGFISSGSVKLFTNIGGQQGAVIIPPLVPSPDRANYETCGPPLLWLYSSRNELFIHPHCRKDVLCFTPFSVDWQPNSFFTLQKDSTMQFSSIGLYSNDRGGSKGYRGQSEMEVFNMHAPLPTCSFPLGSTATRLVVSKAVFPLIEMEDGMKEEETLDSMESRIQPNEFLTACAASLSETIHRSTPLYEILLYHEFDLSTPIGYYPLQPCEEILSVAFVQDEG
ncbi:CPSF A subunit region protein, partial [Cardiosporidium cionae]